MPFSNGAISAQRGPFRVAAYPTTPSASTAATTLALYNNWLPRDTMAWLSDGTSNQILVGEKHLSSNAATVQTFENCGNAVDASYNDCSYLVGGWTNMRAMGAFVRASGNDDGATYSLGSNDMDVSDGNIYIVRPDQHKVNPACFGSWHPGLCNFVFGDGAVRPLSVTTPRGMLARLGTVNDGEAVQLPQ